MAVGVGTRPWVPEPARGKLGDSQFHVSEFLEHERDLAGKRVVVVGGGQSGAEVFLDLLSRPAEQCPGGSPGFPGGTTTCPIDDTPFTNEYYIRSYSDYFFELDRSARVALNARNVLTSDGISESTLREIYQRCYAHRFVDGAEDLFALLPEQNGDRG